MDKNSNNNRSLLICLAMTFVTAAVFYQVCTYDFVNFDDPICVYENPHIQTGITLKTIKWAFVAEYAYNWHPLTWLSHMLDWQLYGNNAGGHHITNLIFHIANTLILFMVMKRMTSVLWQSAFVAALFALHPLHVESVAWISERKDVLSTFFLLLTMWAYLRYIKSPNIARYLLTLFTFVLGLMAKPMLVTLPFILLLLDYWPLARIDHFRWRTLYRLIFEKIPFIILSMVSSVITFFAQQSGGAVATLTMISIKYRVYNAFISYVQYIIKMIWPVRLAVFYPHPRQNVSVFYAIASAGFLLVITILVFRFAKNHRYLVTGWFWYLGTLLPVIGLAQVGSQAMADRYSYITLTGLFIIIAWGLPELLGKWPQRKIVLWISSLMVLSALAVCANLQLRYWKNSITIFQHALNVTKNNYMAHFCMTPMLLEQGRVEEAIRHSSEAVRIKPDYADAINALGASLYRAGKIDEAIGHYERALEIDSHVAMAHLNLASAYLMKGDFAQAVWHYEMAEKTQDMIIPDDPNILNGIGYAFANSGEFEKAISLYYKALKIVPDSINIRLNLGFALVGSGRLEEAIKEYEEILFMRPDNAVAHNSLGVIFSQQGKINQAIVHFNQAVRINPQYTDAKNNLSVVLAEKQKLQNEKKEMEGMKK